MHGNQGGGSKHSCVCILISSLRGCSHWVSLHQNKRNQMKRTTGVHSKIWRCFGERLTRDTMLDASSANPSQLPFQNTKTTLLFKDELHRNPPGSERGFPLTPCAHQFPPLCAEPKENIAPPCCTLDSLKRSLETQGSKGNIFTSHKNFTRGKKVSITSGDDFLSDKSHIIFIRFPPPFHD